MEPPMAKKNDPDAIALLKADHRAVEKLFAQYDKAWDSGRKRELAAKICKELTVHTWIEEGIFYPACCGAVDQDMLDEAFVEHDGAKVLIAEIDAGGPDEDFFDAKVKVLSEMIEHHIEEEERRVEGLFSKARSAGLDMDRLAERMAAKKQELLASIKASGLPRPRARTMERTRLAS
jgi:hypothetical protein